MQVHRTKVIWIDGGSIIIEDPLPHDKIAEKLHRDGFYDTVRADTGGDAIRYTIMKAGVAALSPKEDWHEFE